MQYYTRTEVYADKTRKNKSVGLLHLQAEHVSLDFPFSKFSWKPYKPIDKMLQFLLLSANVTLQVKTKFACSARVIIGSEWL